MNAQPKVVLLTSLFFFFAVVAIDRDSQKQKQQQRQQQKQTQLTMLSRRKTLVLDVDEMARFDCLFEATAFNLFDYPVLWRKLQDVETTQINIMGNINEPFISTGRYEAFFEQNTTVGVYNLGLSIVDTRIEDSGNYTCEVRGPHSVILGIVTHFLYIKDAVKRVVITEEDLSSFDGGRGAGGGGGGASMVGLSYNDTTRVIHLVENTPSFLRCLAFGGYPPPSLHLYFGRRDVTDRFTGSRAATLHGDEAGLRRICVRSERKTYAYRPTSEDDGAKFQCIASVPDTTNSYKDYVYITVDYSPKVSCAGAEAHLGERNVVLKCDIRAKPSLIRTHWVIDANGTKLSEDNPTDSNGDLNIVTAVRVDGIVETQLVIRQARKEFFRNYSVFAQNRISDSTTEVILSQKHSVYRGRDAQHDASRRRSSLSSSSSSSFDSRHHHSPATSGAAGPKTTTNLRLLFFSRHSLVDDDHLPPSFRRLSSAFPSLLGQTIAAAVGLTAPMIMMMMMTIR